MTRVVGASKEFETVPEPARGGVRSAGSFPITKPVRNVPGTMSRSIHCLHCGVSLTLPPEAEGRRVKCPKCGGRFQVGGLGDAPKPAAPGAQVPDHPDSTFELPRKSSSGDLPVVPDRPSSGDLPFLPVAEGDLRETFELPMMTEGSVAAPSKSPAAGRSTADATALFDDKPVAPRRKTGAEARATARRCPTCGGVVPVGMSVCKTCGLDLESGTRVDLMDDLSPPPAPRNTSLPIAMTIVGGLSLAASVMMGAFASFRWLNGTAGAQYFIPVAAFGIYAAVQFLRARSIKLLLVALTLGAVIDLVALIALPIANAQAETQVVQRTTATDDPDAADELIRPLAERLDTNQITTGIALLVLYALVCVYLLSPQVQKQFRK